MECQLCLSWHLVMWDCDVSHWSHAVKVIRKNRSCKYCRSLISNAFFNKNKPGRVTETMSNSTSGTGAFQNLLWPCILPYHHSAESSACLFLVITLFKHHSSPKQSTHHRRKTSAIYASAGWSWQGRAGSSGCKRRAGMFAWHAWRLTFYSS